MLLGVKMHGGYVRDGGTVTPFKERGGKEDGQKTEIQQRMGRGDVKTESQRLHKKERMGNEFLGVQ